MTTPALRVVDWSALDASARDAVLRRPSSAALCVEATVGEILDAVRCRGDAALDEYCARFDAAVPASRLVDDDEFAFAAAQVAPELAAAIAHAAARIEAWHRASMPVACSHDTADGVRCERILRPIRRVGLYVPAGSAPLPSTLLMLGIPARIAGCRDVVVCTPPRADGSADPAVLYAARACGITRVFKLGGAQAIAAMAYGTASVPSCDKLFGPGNAWVTEAKRQACLRAGVAIDMPAGPSEVLVIADAGADPRFVAADLLSQAEHGPDSQVLLVSDSRALIDAVARELATQLEALPRAAIARAALAGSLLIEVTDIAQALAVSNAYAPEHLILAVREPRRWLESVQAAGSVFLGDWAPEALGDYCSGTNHVLPTGGAARATSGLDVASFQTAISVQSVERTGLEAIGPTAVTLARAEQLEAHARAVEVRLEAA
ncbi:MAG: histidinol dehydrogenase [Arenimonas sp.]